MFVPTCRRAVAAAERLVLLCGERCPKERRDLAVLYLHSGRLAAARVELEHFAARAAKVRQQIVTVCVCLCGMVVAEVG